MSGVVLKARGHFRHASDVHTGVGKVALVHTCPQSGTGGFDEKVHVDF